MICPYKPSLTCAGTRQLADEGRCIGCPAGRASGRPAASGDLPLSPPLAALRRQLRERLEAENKRPRFKPLVNPSCQPLDKSALARVDCKPLCQPLSVSRVELAEADP